MKHELSNLERFARRSVRIAGREFVTFRPRLFESADPWSEWWWAFLKGKPMFDGAEQELSIADFYCGIGGLSLGAAEAASAVGFSPNFRLAVDSDYRALDVYRANIKVHETYHFCIHEMIDYFLSHTYRYEFGPRFKIERLNDFTVDLFLAGPPRIGKVKSSKKFGVTPIIDAVSCAIALRAECAVFETVPDIEDRDAIRAVALLDNSGYKVTTRVIATEELGWPQRRSHFFILASRLGMPQPELVIAELRKRAVGAEWAIADLASLEELPAERIEVEHIVRFNEPSPTITAGFKRLMHPYGRPITLHEAARLQGFPDTFDFGDAQPKRLAKWIGNACPSILGYAATLAVLYPKVAIESVTKRDGTVTKTDIFD